MEVVGTGFQVINNNFYYLLEFASIRCIILHRLHRAFSNMGKIRYLVPVRPGLSGTTSIFQ